MHHNLNQEQLYTEIQKIVNSSSNTDSLVKSYALCSENRIKNNKKTMKDLLQNISYNEVDKYDALKKGNLVNKRLLKLNVNNNNKYKNVFTLVKHLFYFGLVILALFLMKSKVNFIIFSGLLILLITMCIITLIGDIKEIYI